MLAERLGRRPPPRRAGVFEVFVDEDSPRLAGFTAARTLVKLLTPPFTLPPGIMWPFWYEVLSVWALAKGLEKVIH